MTHASLFSGIGGPEVAAAMLGWTNAFHCEINDFGRSILEYWFPNSVSYEDITKTDFREWRGRIDVLTGGFPCQPFSYAGRRGGAQDDRYLWPQMLRAIDEIRPAWVVGENVAGLATMVEGGILADLGGEATLFQEGDDLHRYELEQTFTIERICKDLERLGYTVQPVLIPAAAVGAPYRRDRIFILAANSDCRNDLPKPGDDAGEGREERLPERDAVRLAGVADNVRSEVCCTSADSADFGLPGTPNPRAEGSIRGEVEGEGDKALGGIPAAPAGRGRAAANADCADIQRRVGEPEEGQRQTENGSIGLARGDEDVAHSDSRRLERASEGRGQRAGNDALRSSRDRSEEDDTPDADCEGREKPQQPGRGEDRKEDGAGMDDRAERPCGDGLFTDSGMLPENRWAVFPTVSPVHRGNDGIPFPMDGLTVPPIPKPPTYGKGDPSKYPFAKWRTESLKAYGNAIVPQVIYRIFQAIEEASK